MARRFLYVILMLSVSLLLLVACQDEDPTPTVEPAADAAEDASAGESGEDSETTTGDEPAEETVTEDDTSDGETAGEGSGEAELSEDEAASEETATEDQPATEAVSAEVISLSPPIILEPPTQPALESGATMQHNVVQNEWLTQIARCYGAPYDKVLAANPSLNPDLIHPGTIVTVPDVVTVRPGSGPPCITPAEVQPGDTWDRIAQGAGTTSVILQKANPGPLLAGRVIFVPINQASAPEDEIEVPVPTHNLLFSYEGDLARWTSSVSDVEVYSIQDDAEIVGLATNSQGKPILVQQVVSDPIGTAAQMSLVNLDDNSATLIPNTYATTDPVNPFFENLVMSPQGSWSGYGFLPVELDNSDPETNVAMLTTIDSAAPAIMNLDQAPMDIATFLGPQLFPMDEEYLLWMDNHGIWQVAFDLEQGVDSFELLYEIDPQEFGPIGFFPISWTPDSLAGLLLNGFFFEGSQHFVLDPQDGEPYPIPDSGGYVTEAAVTWLPDSQLAVLTPPFQSTGPLFSLYSLYEKGQPGDQIEGLFKQDSKNLILPDQTLRDADIGYRIYAPAVQPEVGNVLFAISANGTADHGLWSANPATGETTLLNSWPSGPVLKAHWVPDGSGVLVVMSNDQDGLAGEVIYVPADGGSLFSFSNWLGINIDDFAWVP